jgi:protocatechuate 3,4-dioxygenase beta subunit
LVASTTAAAATIATGDALAQAARCVLTDNAGEGPFYFDPDLIRSDVTDDMPGAPLSMAMQITRASDCAALGGARVDVWQANAIGLYSGYENQPGVGGVPTETAVGQTWLRGTQLTDADGWVRFSTIYPSWYGGRTPHLHFKVWLGPDEVVASQVFFPDETSAYVFEQFEPYRSHIGKRTTFNDNDPLQQGVYCETERSGDGGISASTVISVAVA